MMSKKIAWLGLLVLLLLWPASVALADQPTWQFQEGRIFTDENVSLEPGETFEGDLGLFSGNLDLPKGSTVNGDVFVANGDARIGGRINGSLAVIDGVMQVDDTGWVTGDVFGMGGKQIVAGQVRGDLAALFGDMLLRSSAVVEGDLMVAPGNLEREAGAQVLGEQVQGLTIPRLPALRERLQVPAVPRITPPAIPDLPQWTPPEVTQPVRPFGSTFGQRLGNFVGRTFAAGFMTLVVVALGVFVVLVWPRPTRRVADCIAAIPAQSFGLGLLTFLIAAGLEALAGVLMIIIILVAAALIGTVILIPVGLLLLLLSGLILLPVPIALAGGMVLGWVGLSELVGNRVLKVFKASSVKPLGATLVGLFITAILAAILWIAKPVCCAWPFVILLSSLGLGAVVHTRFGRVSCQSAPPASPGAASPPEAPAGDQAMPADAMDEEAGKPDLPPAAGA
jgi:hypothetical protein